MANNDSVSVTIVTYDSGRFIKRCLESVLDQKYPFLDIVVIDNCSTDGTTDILEPFEDRVRIIYNDENIGFAAAQNQAIALSDSDWVLTLNPDVLLLPDFHRSAGSRRKPRPPDRYRMRQAADHELRFRLPRKTRCRFHRHLLSPPPSATWTAVRSKSITAITASTNTSSVPQLPPHSTAAK